MRRAITPASVIPRIGVQPGGALARVAGMALLAVLAAPAAGQKEADERVAPSAKAPGGKLLEWTSPEGRPYWYRVPERIDPKRPPNLLLMLHGTGLNHGWSFWNYPILSGRWRGEDVVVSPDGLTPGQGDTFNFLQGKADGEQIEGLIRTFREAFPIGNVYLYGHSQGAFFCYWFAGEHPELVDGIVAHAGNVLDVKHTKLSREKVAVAILHGRADAVVPVECATRTEKIYRDEGYRNVRLEIVEGLTETSGHWPLPDQVAELLAWLDQVCAKTPDQALRVASSELRQEAPDLAVVARALDDAAALLKKHRGEDGEALAVRLAGLEAWLADLAARQAEALLAAPELTERTPAFGAWAGHFVEVDAPLAGRSAWSGPTKALRATAARHGKDVDKLLAKSDDPDKGLFRDGLAALREDFLAPRLPELQALLLRLADAPPKGVASEDVEALRALVAEREAAWAEGRGRARALTAERAAELRTAEPALLGEE